MLPMIRPTFFSCASFPCASSLAAFIAGPRRGYRRALSGLLCLTLVMLSLSGGAVQAQTALDRASGSIALGGATGGGFGGAVAQPDFLRVEEAYPLALEQIGERELLLVWQMPAGYYLYQHAFRFELERAGDTLELAAEYPPAITREDEFFGRVEVYYDSAEITLSSVEPVAGARLRVTSQGCADAGLCYPPRTQEFAIAPDGSVSELTGAASTPSSKPLTTSGPLPASGSGTLLLMMLFAFLGGMILNLMPCVLPILSLKVLGFASAPASERHRHGIYYSIGVICSFMLVAGVLLGLRSAGQAIGWGFQLQSPGFVIGLAYLFVVMGLALSGVVELGNRFMNMGSNLAQSGGNAGSFFTGVLAVVVASPCTAPFMGSALGYALVQPPATGLTVFAALGAGMAMPMFLLSYSETARRLLPQPGQWMERLKQALAFPLYGTALWLFWVAGRQAGVDVMAATLLGALLIALGLWLWRETLVSRGMAISCLVLAVLLAGWRPPQDDTGNRGLPEGTVAYSPAALEQLIDQGKPVFVDVTADWCITCLANERAVLLTDVVQDAFRERRVTYMIADWTDYDPTIADFVASHGRSGIPLYVLYDGPGPPTLLPQLLRKQTVLSALAAVKAPTLAASSSP